jgi:hypothetical protein
MLAIQKYLHEYGLEKTILDFKLKSKDYGHKVLLKYDQIDSDFSKEEVCDCRGLILEKGTWKIMSMAFRKFFNIEEGHAVNIDFDKSRILKKIDGSLIQLYFDWVLDKWCVGTTGTAEAEVRVNIGVTTFAELFWKTIQSKPGKFAYANLDEFLPRGFTYVFELTTPWNINVTPHGTSNATWLAARNLETLKEFSYEELEVNKSEYDLTLVESYSFVQPNYATLRKTFEHMVYSKEGYVVWDGVKRVKVKNPAYVAAHYLKSSLAEYKIMSIIKTNEIDEFIASFPDRKEEIEKLTFAYKNLKQKLNDVWNILKEELPKEFSKESSKKYAADVFSICKLNNIKEFTGLYFSLKDKKVESVNSFLLEYNDKYLFNICTDKKSLFKLNIK